MALEKREDAEETQSGRVEATGAREDEEPHRFLDRLDVVAVGTDSSLMDGRLTLEYSIREERFHLQSINKCQNQGRSPQCMIEDIITSSRAGVNSLSLKSSLVTLASFARDGSTDLLRRPCMAVTLLALMIKAKFPFFKHQRLSVY